jgi:hypothetical protein
MKTKSVLTTLFLTVSMAFTVLAQDFQITSSTLGAGGSSSGGEYALTGTADSAAKKLSGGDFSITSGFMAGVVILPTPGAPNITVTRDGNAIVLSWITADSSWTLESVPTLGTGASWSAANLTIMTNDNTRSVTLPNPTGVQFFRLKKAVSSSP